MNAGCVYVVAFEGGTVKIGKTRNVAQRLSAHKSDARKWGQKVTDKWVSPPHAEWEQNEDALKEIALGLGGTALSPEYFSGVGFAAVVEKACELPFTPPEADEEKAADLAGRWAALKDDLAGRIQHVEATRAKRDDLSAQIGSIFYAAALADVQRWVAEIEAEYPEPAST